MYGCGGIGQDRLGRPELHEPAGVHDGEPIGEAGDDTQVVGDDQDRHPELGAQPPQQLQDLGLDRHVERGGRLVGDQQARLTAERHRDHRPLAHPTAELVRVVVDALVRPGDADQLEQLDRPLLGLLLADVAVRLDRLGDLAADRQHRVEARQGILEDHRDLGATDLAQALLRQVEDVLALEDRGPGRDLADPLGQQAEQRQRAHALAGAGLSDEADGLAGRDVVGQAAHRADDAPATAELDEQAVDRQQRRAGSRAVADDRRGVGDGVELAGGCLDHGPSACCVDRRGRRAARWAG